MKLTFHRRAETFMGRVGHLLAADEPSSSMLLGVCSEVLHSSAPRPGAKPLLMSLEDAGEILLVGVQASPYGLVVQPCRDLPRSRRGAVVSHFVEAWGGEDLPLTSVLGPQDLVEELAAAWTARHGGSHRPWLRMRLYSLRRVLPPAPRPKGCLRRADADDATLVKAWFHAFGREALGAESADAAHQTAEHLLRLGEVYLWQEETVKAMVARARATRTTAFLGYAYTPPELRGQGLATCYIAALSQRLLDRGFERCALFTDLDNAVTNRIYPRVGYRSRGDFYKMVCSAAD